MYISQGSVLSVETHLLCGGTYNNHTKLQIVCKVCQSKIFKTGE